jgi:hypothetical protein
VSLSHSLVRDVVVGGGGRRDRVEGVEQAETAEGDTVDSTVEEKHAMINPSREKGSRKERWD